MTQKSKVFTMTDKDYEIIDTLKTLKLMTSSQIQRLFFAHRSGQCRRCLQLVANKKIKSYKDPAPGTEVKYYYKRKPTQQVKSMLVVSEFYVRVKLSKVNLISFQREFSVPITDNFTIRPDARMIVEYDGIEYEFFIEVDNRKTFSSDKYYKAIKLGFYPPPIISISDLPRKVYNNMEVIKMDMQLNSFDKFIDNYF